MGLQLDNNGHNIAFTGGTGILVFLDVVAMVLLDACSETIPSEIRPNFGPDFKFTLYFAAPSEEEAIGLQLCEKVFELTQKLGQKSFNLVLRISGKDTKLPRWDKAYLSQQLKPLAGQISKISVCGAPQMNETFDRAFEEIMSVIDVKPQDIEIL